MVDGTEYYVIDGNYYPLEGEAAQIWNPVTKGEVWPYGGVIRASFDFKGHGATQSTTWSLTKLSSGARIAGETTSNYGSHTGLALSPFRKTYSGEIAIAHPYECDLRLAASTTHSAWWVGVAVVGSKPYVSPGIHGLTPAASAMKEMIRECGSTTDDGDPGGDGGCDGDVCDEPDPTCTSCQEWLYYSISGEYLYNEWECEQRSGSFCTINMS